MFKSSLFCALKVFAGTPGEKVTEAREEIDGQLRGKHILLAEDNELNWEVARELLSSLVLPNSNNLLLDIMMRLSWMYGCRY